MSIGDQILDEITKQAMFRVAHPDPDVAHVFVWSSGAAEQLDAVVAAAIEAGTAKAARTSMQRIRTEVIGLSNASCADVERVIRESIKSSL